MRSRPVLLAAGGTGGHLFPAAALAEELRARGSTVSLATDSRAEKYRDAFAAEAVHRIPSATLTSRSPLAVASTFARLGAGYADALLLLARLRPRAVFGFGGYPTLPPIIAARTLRIPTAIHEQNAVMGRANRLLSRFADRIALSFIPTNLLSDTVLSKTSLVGIPVREAVLAFRNTPYHPPDPAERLRLLVFGGSQGAHFFSEVLPPALLRLAPQLRNRLSVVQQAREEDMRGAQEAYRKANIEAVVAPFFRDLPERIASAHLVIARAGASTVAELTTVGRPALLVPLPHALDNDQLENATRLEQAGGGWCVSQSGLTGERLAKLIEDLLSAPARLAEAAARSHAMARPDAVKLLADLVEEIARPQEPSRHAHA